MNKKLFCSPDKKICGVCAGIADYFNIDPSFVRAGAAIIAIYTAVIPAAIVYFVCALIIPQAPDNYYQIFRNTSKRLTKGRAKAIAGVCSGIGEYFNVDIAMIRILFVVMLVFFGSGLLAYIVCAIIFPNPDQYYDSYSQNGYQNNGYGGFDPRFGDQNPPPYNQNGQNYNDGGNY